MLPEDQKRIVTMVRSIASKYGLGVEVIDVGRENILHRTIQKEREKIGSFPALLADSGERIEGEITKDRVESLFSHIAEKIRKKYI